jgi:hypothetical protein
MRPRAREEGWEVDGEWLKSVGSRVVCARSSRWGMFRGESRVESGGGLGGGEGLEMGVNGVVHSGVFWSGRFCWGVRYGSKEVSRGDICDIEGEGRSDGSRRG